MGATLPNSATSPRFAAPLVSGGGRHFTLPPTQVGLAALDGGTSGVNEWPKRAVPGRGPKAQEEEDDARSVASHTSYFTSRWLPPDLH